MLLERDKHTPKPWMLDSFRGLGGREMVDLIVLPTIEVKHYGRIQDRKLNTERSRSWLFPNTFENDRNHRRGGVDCPPENRDQPQWQVAPAAQPTSSTKDSEVPVASWDSSPRDCNVAKSIDRLNRLLNKDYVKESFREDAGFPDSNLGSTPKRPKRRWAGITLQPEFSPISQEQLAAEVKGIYAGLVTVEAKYLDIDKASQPNDSATPSVRIDPTGRHSRSTPQTRHTAKPPHQLTELVVHGRLQGVDTVAFPDTGASSNFISERYARLHGFAVDRSARSHVKVGSGSKINIIGTAKLTFTFDGELEAHHLTFNVLRNSLYDVVLGSPFLRLTQTFTRFTHRIRRRTRNVFQSNFFKMCLLGSHQFVSGLTNGIPVNAIPDTGAEVSVMSASFARAMGFTVNSEEQHRVLLGFADCSTAKTIGVVEDMPWNFYGGGRSAHLTDVYVLADLPVDLVLGNDFLWETNAFVEYENDFWHVEDDGQDESFLLNLIRVIKACTKAGSSTHADTDAAMNANLHTRQAEALAAYCRARNEARDRNLTGDEETQYLKPYVTTWQQLRQTDPGRDTLSTDTSSASSGSSSNPVSASSSQPGGPQGQATLNAVDLSGVPDRSREKWFKRAFRWPSARRLGTKVNLPPS